MFQKQLLLKNYFREIYAIPGKGYSHLKSIENF